MTSDSSIPLLSAFEPLQRIGDDLYLYEPSTASGEAEAGPSLIVLFTWLGGSTPRRIQKYIDGYRTLWPNAAILLVAARLLEFAALPFSHLRARLLPSREVIRRYIKRNDIEPPILLHIFSNGGLYNAIQLALSMQQPDNGDPSLQLGPHVRCIILDCCPGQTEFWRTYTAAMFSVPPTMLAQLLGRPFFFFIVGLHTSLTTMGLVSGVRDYRQQLNSPSIFGTSARRLYMYSNTDQIVGFKDVESHIEEAKSQKGYDVETVLFPNSHHCALVRNNETQYWNAIEKFWRQDGSSTEEIDSFPPLMTAPRSRL